MRQYNILKRAGVQTINDLLDADPEELVEQNTLIRVEDIDIIDDALLWFRLCVGYDHEPQEVESA